MRGEGPSSATPRAATRARVALLVERVRAGERPPERLALAAHLGDPTAAAALGAPPPADDDDDAWFAALAALGGEVPLRALLAALARAPALAGRSGTRGLTRGLDAGFGWIVGPCGAAHQAALLGATLALGRAQEAFAARYGRGAGVRFTDEAACTCAGAAAPAVDAPDLVRGLALPGAVPWLAPAGLTAAQVRAALAADLLPWALA
jgi:hypothetical protein